MMEGGKRCGSCRWHFDLAGHTEGIGVKNCLAQPVDLCAAILSTEDAICNRPEDYAPVSPERKSDAPPP